MMGTSSGSVCFSWYSYFILVYFSWLGHFILICFSWLDHFILFYFSWLLKLFGLSYFSLTFIVVGVVILL